MISDKKILNSKKKHLFCGFFFIYNQSVYFLSERKEGFHSQIQMPR